MILVAGVGNGAATAVGWPLLTALIPPTATGTFAGLKAAAESVAIPVSVFIAAEVFLPRFSYRGVFALLAVAIVFALFILLRFVPVAMSRRATDVAGIPTRLSQSTTGNVSRPREARPRMPLSLRRDSRRERLCAGTAAAQPPRDTRRAAHESGQIWL